MTTQLKTLFCIFLLLGFVSGTLVSCVGPDYTPDFFGLRKEKEEPPLPSEDEKPPAEKTPAIEIFKLVVGEGGRQTEVAIPLGRILEIGTGTFIAKSETDIGPKYRSSAKFKVMNPGDDTVEFSLPHQIGPFFISSISSQKQKLAPKQLIIIDIEFAPTSELVGESGKITEELDIGGKTFGLLGIALESSGLATINIINSEGNAEISNADAITFPEISLSAHPLRQFFRCGKISCNGEAKLTNCRPCLDVIGGACELLPVNKDGVPVDSVTKTCKPVTKDIAPMSEINLTTTDISSNKVQKKIIEILNTGPEPLIIDSITIGDPEPSKSKGEFSVNTNAIFIADTFTEVKQQIQQAPGNSFEVPEFPIALPPFDPPALTTRLFMVVAYHPKNIIGSNGVPAAVGSSAKDEAFLNIESKEISRQIHLVGTTTIKEIPALQIYVKSSTGTRPIANGETLPFKDITSTTYDLALPLFMKLSDAATDTLRITSITLDGKDYEWLDTTEKINARPEEARCAIPVFDETGSQVDIITDLKPASLNPNGFQLKQGAYTTNTMPLFGCINFHRDPEAPLEKTVFKATMTITAQQLNAAGQVATNPNGSTKEMTFSFGLLGVIDPIRGKAVLRLTQTMAAVMNPDFPSISSIASNDEMNLMIADGVAKESDKNVFIMPIILDPFDEETIYNSDGTVATVPGDNVTAVFFPIDTRAIPVTYDDPRLSDYTSLIHDSLLPEGRQGIFTGFPNLPSDFRTNALKIFTGSLSYPGPIVPMEERPHTESECEHIDPCTTEGLRKLGEGSSNPAYRGVCAFFYVTAGNLDSPALLYPNEDPRGTRREMCKDREKPYSLKPIMGRYSLDGKMEFDNFGMFFQGPTYVHTPWGPLGQIAKPLDELFKLTFTTEPILPITDTKDVDRIPDKRIDIAKGEYKINLNDPYSNLPKLCENNTDNRYLHGEKYSTWRYIAPLLKKDKEGTIPAGCPEEDNNFTGGTAYLSGKRMEQETRHTTFVAAAKFSSSDGLTFAFKDVMLFIVLNGWFCDPSGPEEDMEGVHCYDKTFNERDAITQFSIIKEAR